MPHSSLLHPTLLSVSAFMSFLRSFLLAIIFFSVLGLVTACVTIDFLWFSSLRCLASSRCFLAFCSSKFTPSSGYAALRPS